MIDHLLAMDPGDSSRKLEGIVTREPAFNLPAVWIPKDKEEEAKFAGYTVVDIPTVIATHLTEVIRNNAADLMGRQETQHLLDHLSKTHPKAVEELVPGLLSLGAVQKVLQNLLKERISIRDLLTIVETLADYAQMSKDPDLLTEYVRQKLSRSILSPFIQADGVLNVLTVDAGIEDLFAKSLKRSEHGMYLALEPGSIETISASIQETAEKVILMNLQPIILCSPAIRRHLRKIVEQIDPAIMVISHAEIMQNIRIQASGKVTLAHGN
jgi:flagellar biosynthesis protein FlhA